MTCDVVQDLAWLWLWRWPAAVALIRPLVGEPPYATSVAIKSKKKKTKKKKTKKTQSTIVEIQKGLALTFFFYYGGEKKSED